eukprot:3444338-Rhodomonas_salina.1
MSGDGTQSPFWLYLLVLWDIVGGTKIEFELLAWCCYPGSYLELGVTVDGEALMEWLPPVLHPLFRSLAFSPFLSLPASLCPVSYTHLTLPTICSV